MHLKARFGMHRLNALNLGGPRHGVPMAQIAAHREHQGIGITGWFGQTQWLLSHEAGPPRRGGKTVIAVQPLGFCGGFTATGERPLLGSVLRQQRMAEARDIA